MCILVSSHSVVPILETAFARPKELYIMSLDTPSNTVLLITCTRNSDFELEPSKNVS
jgi:hypothetical protein